MSTFNLGTAGTTPIFRSFQLPPECILRRACATDAQAIKLLISTELLNPTGINWSNFWVIENNRRLVAIGQLRRHPGIQELGSIMVAPNWRTQGLGTHLVQHLIEQATAPLYLSCGARLIPFYAPLGFVPISWLALPYPLKIKFGITKLFTTLLGRHLVFMQHCHPND